MKNNVHPAIWAGAGFLVGGIIGLFVGAAICFFLFTAFTTRRTIVTRQTVSPTAPAPAVEIEAAEIQSDVGKSFNSISELFAYYDAKGFIMLGRFDKSQWPATILSVQDATNEIRVVRKGGPLHHYPNYTGYRLKGVTLEDPAGGETLVVLRSKEKINPP